MKKHPIKVWGEWSGMNVSYDKDRIPDDALFYLLNAQCDRTGKILKSSGFYPVTLAEELGLITGNPEQKIHKLARFRGKQGDQLALCVIGGSILRSNANDIYSTWNPITFPAEIETPGLDRDASIVFRNRYAYHQNGVDIPFRIEMETTDGSEPPDIAEPLGLRPPIHPPKIDFLGSPNGKRFPPESSTGYCVTFVYGDRGESGPSPVVRIELLATNSKDSLILNQIPVGPSGVTSRKIYRTVIGRGAPGTAADAGSAALNSMGPITNHEYFFLKELKDNSTTTYTDDTDDSSLDFSMRVPPRRPFPPISRYQVLHQDKFVWANIQDHPWTMGFHSDPSRAITSATLTIDNTGDGTITLTTNLGTTTITVYKTRTIRQIVALLAMDFSYDGALPISTSTAGILGRGAPGIDWEKKYTLREVTNQNVLGGENTYWVEAIADADAGNLGPEKFPNRIMFSNTAYPEEINPLNVFDLAKDDAYPVTGIFRDNFTCGVMTADNIWLMTGSFSVDPDTFEPDFSISRSQSEHGSICTRQDAVCETPYGIYFVARDGLRRFRGDNSERTAMQIDKLLMARIRVEPRARDAVCLHYDSGQLLVAYPGVEVV